MIWTEKFQFSTERRCTCTPKSEGGQGWLGNTVIRYATLILSIFDCIFQQKKIWNFSVFEFLVICTLGIVCLQTYIPVLWNPFILSRYVILILQLTDVNFEHSLGPSSLLSFRLQYAICFKIKIFLF